MDAIKDVVDFFATPEFFFGGTFVALILIVWKREAFASNRWGWGLMGFLGVFFLFGLFDENFQLIIGKPDNVPIVALIFLLVFFTWFSIREGVRNDRRIAAGEPPLEQPANNANTPNPSKAPWYFLGLQEMLVYFDPWLAGVVLPSLIIVGLMAIPYVDKNPKGNGYYTFTERKAEITIFLFGFVVLWSSLIVLGTFLRGPNWNFFGPFEFWDIHKLEPLTNVQLSEYIWVYGFGRALPEHWFVREIFGLLLVAGYIGVLPVALAKKGLTKYYEMLGPTRYYVSVLLFLMMLSLPIKMLSRWVFNLKYIVSIPEFFFNI